MSAEVSAPRLPRRVRVGLVGGLLVILVVVPFLALANSLTPSLAVPTSRLVRADPTAVFDTGAALAVRAVRHGALVCFYTADQASDRLVFPAGYSASTELRLRDERGNEVAGPGAQVGIAYGDVTVRAPAACGTSGDVRAVVRIAELTG